MQFLFPTTDDKCYSYEQVPGYDKMCIVYDADTRIFNAKRFKLERSSKCIVCNKQTQAAHRHEIRLISYDHVRETFSQCKVPFCQECKIDIIDAKLTPRDDTYRTITDCQYTSIVSSEEGSKVGLVRTFEWSQDALQSMEPNRVLVDSEDDLRVEISRRYSHWYNNGPCFNFPFVFAYRSKDDVVRLVHKDMLPYDICADSFERNFHLLMVMGCNASNPPNIVHVFDCVRFDYGSLMETYSKVLSDRRKIAAVRKPDFLVRRTRLDLNDEAPAPKKRKLDNFEYEGSSDDS